MKFHSLFSFKILILFLFVTLCSMCVNESNPFDEALLKGSWIVEKWTIESSGKSRANKMDMTFTSDGNYEIDYGPESEVGRYWISGNYLHTFEKNESEKKVLLLKLVSDTLEIQMNRAGEMENVVLKRK